MNSSVRSQALFSIVGGLVLGAALAMSACGGDDDGDDSGSGGSSNGGSSNGGTSTAGTAGQGLTSLRKNTAPSAK